MNVLWVGDDERLAVIDTVYLYDLKQEKGLWKMYEEIGRFIVCILC